jgi:Undecaprenyl-phosphate galactose phosphotransferase WbaP
MSLVATSPQNDDHATVSSVVHATGYGHPLELSPGTRRSTQWPNAFSFLVGDFSAFGTAGAMGGLIAYALESNLLGVKYLAFEEPNLIQQLAILGCIASGLCAWFALAGHYTERRPFRTDLGEILSASLVGLLISGFIEFAGKVDFSRLWLFNAWLLAAISVPVMRIVVRKTLNACGMWMVNAVIIGKGPHRDTVKSALSGDFFIGYRVISDGAIEHANRSRLDFLLRETNAGAVILIPSDDEMQYLTNIIDYLNVRMMPYKVVPPIDRLPLAGLSTQSFISCDAVMLTVQAGLASPLSQAMKRLFDIILSAAMLIALLPLMLVVAFAVSADGGPIFFGHERVGRRGQLFQCLKFRTMMPNAGKALEKLLERNPEARREWRSTQKLRDDPRTTNLGRLLRATSIDELPQLINVFRGEMSLVGPRPVVQQELHDHYKSDNSYYLLVRPGITGLWQTSGRTEVGYQQRVHLDAWYVRNWSLWGDIIILFRTLPAVIAGKGAC